MGNWRHRILLISLIFSASVYYSNANSCSVVGSIPFIPANAWIVDEYRGTFWQNETVDIARIYSINYDENTGNRQYVSVQLVDSYFVLATTALFEQYEEYETSLVTQIHVRFECTGSGVTNFPLSVPINVIDTNNHWPEFIEGPFVFTIFTPVPPGFELTGCFNDITVRDIDLTTIRIDFEIEENPNFEIAYDRDASTTPKEFKALLRTKKFIRTIPEPITLTISATDVDSTNDPSLTTSTTVTIIPNTDFEIPEEPVFSKTFYLADYTHDNEMASVVLTEPITLQSGYDEFVQFHIEGDYPDNFELVSDPDYEDQRSIRVLIPLVGDVLMKNNIHLIVRAEREHTSGASATVVLRLPEVVPLEFENSLYEGTIENNYLRVPQLILSQGYEGETVTARVINEHSSYFTASVEVNIVTLTMEPLDENIITENSFINLEVFATTGRRTTTTIVTLKIIKDDNVTPVFDWTVYNGTYSNPGGLTHDQIVLVQGYDGIDEVALFGDYSIYFATKRNGATVTIEAIEPIPPEIYSRERILLSLEVRKPRTVGASAAIIITLPAVVPLEFEKSYYQGTIENNYLRVPQLILSQGYEGETVTARVINEHSSYFTASVEEDTVTLTMEPLDENIITENSFINLEVFATTGRRTTTTIVTLKIIKDDNVTPVFDWTVYNGTYSNPGGLTHDQIVLLQGYDGIDEVALFGDYSIYFATKRNGATVTIEAIKPIPPEIYSRERILLSLEVRKPRTVGASAAVIITLPAARALEFGASTHRGSLQGGELNLDPIRLTVGYEDNVRFSISGDHKSYFHVTNDQNLAIITLDKTIPSGVISENNIIILTLAASGLNAVTTTTSVLLDIIKDDTTTPVFSRNIYYGTYMGTSNLNIIDGINLTQGFDSSVTFSLGGDHAQYFDFSNDLNNIVVFPRSSVPEDVIFKEKVLVFYVLATKAHTVGASATISIRFPSELTDQVIMRFTQNTYTGTIDSSGLSVDDIVLSSGYAPNTDFILSGDYSTHFKLTPNNNAVSLSLDHPLPIDATENAFIVLEIEAKRERAVSVWTSVVIEIVKEEIVSPVFTQPYYRGVYNPESGLEFNEVISLSYGFDETVTLALDGKFSSLFALVPKGINSKSLVLSEPISNEVLQENSHLLFTVVATKPGALNVRSTISIDIIKEDTQGTQLGFDQVTYLGSIQNNVAHIGPITVIEGYTDDVVFSLYGDLASYFTPNRVGSVVNVEIRTPIPAALIPENRIITLTIRASAPTANTAHATIVFQVVVEDDTTPTVQLAFDAAYYAGSYSANDGLVMETPITLSEGHDNSVQFSLDGDHSVWFDVEPLPDPNSVRLVLKEAIPGPVLVNNRHLVFVINAERAGATTAQATIVISLTDDEDTQGTQLGFDQVTYLGSIQNNVAHIGPITVIEGYTDDVVFSLYGDLASYFTPNRVGSVVNVEIRTPIPAALIPESRIITLTIRASAPTANSAHATIVFQVVVEDDTTPTVQLAFDAAYYAGSYNANDGLVMETPITLSEGHDDSVQFSLHGDHSVWFDVEPLPDPNSVRLVLKEAIPGPVLVNNRHLVFVINAERAGATTAQATIVISLTDDEDTQGTQLGFDQVTYLGSIQNNVAHIGPITVIEGYTDDVVFSLYGDLASYFTPNRVGSVVNVEIRTPIPAALIPESRIITLTIRASAPTANTAHATIVFQVVVEDDTTPTVQLAFDAAYYAGSYNANDGLVMETPITLSEGHDDSVQFSLHGDHSVWFDVEPLPDRNSVRLVLKEAIPGPVLVNNRHLVFVINAERAGATTAQATIVISLTDDEDTQGTQLGFDQVTYLGSIQNNVAHIGPITVIEGYTDDVVFSLYGDLASYFTPNRVGSVVNVEIRTPIPAALIPESRIITLTIRASAPTANTAHATIVFQVVVEDDTTPTVQLAFDAAYYAGSYNANDGLVMETPITLSEGHDDSVQFSLHGDHSVWFDVEPLPDRNSVRLVLKEAIPGPVLVNNRHLVFVINAERAGATTAQATIVISLTDDEDTQGTQLGFDQVTYLGSIQNNVAHIGPITVIEGYTDDVVFSLYGDLASYFTPNRVGSVVNVEIRTPIPAALIPESRIITLTIRASAPTANTAHATIVFQVVVEDDTTPTVQLAFDAAYYAGSYSANDGLVMETPITLSEGHDDSVQFSLDGDHSVWFDVEPLPDPNSVRLVLKEAIPGPVLVNNRHLVFVINAERAGATTAQATIVISLTDDEDTQGTQLGFDQVTYLGSIQNNVAHIGPITVIEGYTDDVVFSLYGDLASYFTPNRVGSVVNVEIRTPIPAALIPESRIITLTIRASAPTANSAHATIVFQVVVEDDTTPTVQLAFDAAYYAGSYSANDGLVMETPITLSEGHDDSVQFSLDGDHSVWFDVEPLSDPNSVRLVLKEAIPGPVLVNNRHLVFVINAERAGATTAQATIVISLTDDEDTQGTQLGFDQVTYLGSIQNNVAHIGPITVIEGYTDDVVFSLYGDLASYFTPNRVGSVVNVEIRTPIPAALIPESRIITLTIRASAPTANTAHATIVFQVVVEDDTTPTVQLAFDAAYYAGSYSANDGLVMETPITLSEGHDDSVQFSLDGDHSVWFDVEPLPDPNSVRLVLKEAIPGPVLVNNRHLVFVINAERAGATTAQATIVISLTDDEDTQGTQLGFDQVTYLGSIQNNVAHIGPITVIEGYTDDVVFSLYGDLASYFTPNRVGSVVNVEIRTPIPAALIPESRIITLTIRASAPTANTAHATIVFQVVVEDDTTPTVQLAFDAAYYAGSYSANDGLVMETPITLSEGHDDSVQFSLDGDHSVWFDVEPLPDPNSVRLVLKEAIPGPVLVNNRHLVFVINAERAGATTAQATIVISLTDDEDTQGTQLGFDQVTYLGSIQNNVAHIGPITVIEGYTDDVVFSLYGDLASYFTPNRVGSVVNVEIRTPIPAALIPESRIITLTIRASAPTANTAHATIVFQVVVEDDTTPTVQLAFDAAYYAGSYNANDGLVMVTPITLSEGHDDSVQFSLHGDHSVWFDVEPLPDPNSVRLVLKEAIPGPVLVNNRHLVFVINAERAGATTAQATIVISLTDDEDTQGTQLGFDQVTYLGSIQNNVAHIGPITVIEGYTDDVVFSLYGDLASYFTPNRVGSVVNVEIRTPIPAALIPESRIITLTIRASAPTANTAHATIVFQVVVEDDTTPTVQLAFDAAYYAGSYSANDGLVMETPITLSEGHDDSVQFSLDGDHSVWFDVEPLPDPNSVRLVLKEAIPGPVLVNNRHLVFVINAERAGATTAQATIVISLTDDEDTQGTQLGFDQVTYLGSIQNNVAHIGPITVIEGYTDDVVFSLYGDLASYFTPNRVGSVVNVEIRTPIPAALIPESRIITLTIRASAPTANTAHATIVFQVVVEDDTTPTVQLAFDAAYYAGSYNANDGLVMETPITLSEGHDDSVQFSLHGDHSVWFDVEPLPDPNSVRLVLKEAIPGPVLVNNRHLVFVINAERAGATTAQATIVISLTDDEDTQGTQLGFDQVTYLGSIQNNVAHIGPITVIEGYTDDVVFSLYGDLASYFTPNRVGSVVNVEIRTPIPAALIPESRIITLTIRASAPTANSAHATIVFQVVVEDDTTPTVQLAFDAAYYAGSYSANDGLVMETPITLSEGHDDSVQFSLDGDHSVWFDVEPLPDPNSVRLVLKEAIPGPVLVNNRHLVFVINAERAGATTAQATIVISLTDDEDTQGTQLGFDQVTYLGSIQNNVAHIGPITVIEGYTDDVVFSLYGDLASYFTPNRVGSVVNVEIRTPIPAALIPESRIITLTIRASAPTANTAHATIVFQVVVEDDTTPTVQLAFDAAYYAGSYSANDGLVMETPITLSEGHDDSVQFSLDGDHSVWFDVEPLPDPNSVRLVLKEAIPGPVLVNNRHLVFVINAERAGATTAQATIVISLTDDEDTQGTQLGFDQVTYLGSIQNNVAHIGPITVIEGYTDDVVFSLYGDLASYFTPNRVGSVVNVEIRTPIPAALIPESRIITLTIRASAPTANTAHATIVFQVVVEDDTTPTVQLAFDAAYYAGSYNANDGLVMETPITLSEGHDDSVQFSLHGDHSVWFDVEPLPDPNSVRLVLKEAIPGPVLVNNRHLVFVINAERAGATTAQATIVISLTDDEDTQGTQLGFDQVTYLGSIQNNVAHIGPITVIEGYTDDVVFSLYGDLASYFTPNRVGSVVNVEIRTPIPAALIPESRIITLTIRASAPTANTAHATIVFQVVVEDDTTPTVQLAFDAAYYAGSYSANDGLVMETPITLSEGHDDSVQFSLDGDHSVWFDVEPLPDPNSVRLVLKEAIPGPVLVNNRHLVFVINAERAGATTAQATIVISLTDDEDTQGTQLGFDQVTYLGSIQNNVAHIGPITVIEGYTDDVVFSLYGDLASYFTPNRVGSVVNVEIRTPIPAALIPESRIITLTIRASAPTANTAHATIVFQVVVEDDTTPTVQLAFDAAYYAGSYSANDGLVMETPITLSEGHDDSIQFSLDGDHSVWFDVEPLPDPNSVRLVLKEAIPGPVLVNNRHLVFVINAERAGATTAQATIVISLTDDEDTQGTQLGFDQVTYLGSIQNNVAHIGPITVIEGYTDDVVFSLYGDLASYFTANRVGSVVNVEIRTPIPAALIPENRIITLTIRASAPTANTAHATIVFQVVVEDDTTPTVQLAFDAAYYAGSYSANDGLVMETPITLSEGHDDSVQFSLDGDQSVWFDVEPLHDSNSVRLVLKEAIPAPVLVNNRHLVFVINAERAGATTAQATIVISLTDDDVPLIPSVTFSSNSYVLTVGMAQTGTVGQVSATADNEEAITYSLETDNAHLQSYLSVNNEGEMYLSAPADSGIYTIKVIATTVITHAKATALVHLRVAGDKVCEDKDIVMHPLITLDRDEEAAHNNLVVLDPIQHAGCHFTLTNHWPTDQTWVYVDENGLHTLPIDREHPSIALMSLSQVQVELVLHCESDSTIREKRSEKTQRLDPYDGKNKWIFTDTITYNSRRSLVNLIVNDINDNNPIFVGKEHQPIVVGYPTDELEERILPRSLAELKATDADIGENAALRYWSSESVLAVAPTTGFVHVRAGARLSHDQLLTVTATDQNGQGLSGTIQLMVKLLDVNQIAVVTIRDAFLDDETTVLEQLSDAVGYEVKTLRSVVISDDINENVTRNKRNTATTRATLQLYVYGLNQREPVAVDRLAADISSNAAMASVVSTIPLEEHLDDINILDNQIGLLVSTIVLGVLLFALILLVAIWFFFRWRKKRNYDEFNAENSLTSRNASLEELPKPEVMKPRLNIEDLKKSEKRLQEMLDAPIEEVTIEPMPRKMETPTEAILDLHEPSTSIVIQSIDKLKDAAESSDDEFGEVIVKPRKSVVTFNENVEKIIHVEDSVDDDDDYADGTIDINVDENIDALNTGYEFYRL